MMPGGCQTPFLHSWDNVLWTDEKKMEVYERKTRNYRKIQDRGGRGTVTMNLVLVMRDAYESHVKS